LRRREVTKKICANELGGGVEMEEDEGPKRERKRQKEKYEDLRNLDRD
jgi:hypothetical protein